MAGQCWGDGIKVDDQGRLSLSGPRAVAWPGGPSCTLAANSGLKVDPVTGELWVAPRSVISTTAVTKPNRTIVPAGAGIVALSHLELTMTARDCERMLAVFHVTSGYCGMRQGSGNFWIVERYFTIYVNGVAVAFSGSEDIGGGENNSGGAITQLGPVENATFPRDLDPGDVVKLVADYQLNVATYAASGVNNLQWRPPRIEGILYGYPLT